MVATSSDLSNYFGSKSGSQVRKHKEQNSGNMGRLEGWMSGIKKYRFSSAVRNVRTFLTDGVIITQTTMFS